MRVHYPKCAYGCGSVILLRPNMGVAPHKHDVISMPTQQCTNTKHISIERYHPVVSIMLRYLDQIKIFVDNLCCCAVKIDKKFGVIYRTLLSNATTFRNDCENKRSVRTKNISWLRLNENDIGIQRIDFEIPERPRERWDFDALPHGRIVHVHPRLLVKAKNVLHI